MRLIDPLANQTPSLLIRRLILGLVTIYNTLRSTLQCASVKDFQTHLHGRTKRMVEKKLMVDWERLYSLS